MSFTGSTLHLAPTRRSGTGAWKFGLWVLAALSIAYPEASLSESSRAGSGEIPPSESRGGFHRALGWKEPGGEATLGGLLVCELATDGMVTRTLAETPTGSRIRITETTYARSGVMRIELLDETTGWKAAMDARFEIDAPTLNGFFKAVTARPPRELDVRLVLRLPGFDPFERQLKGVSSIYQAFVQEMESTGLTEKVSSTLPRQLAEALLFLDASMSPTPLPSINEDDNAAGSARPIVEVLVGAVKKSPPEGLDLQPHLERWPMTAGPLQNGIGIVDPGLLKLLSNFPSVENADPLSDHRAAVVISAGPGREGVEPAGAGEGAP